VLAGDGMQGYPGGLVAGGQRALLCDHSPAGSGDYRSQSPCQDPLKFSFFEKIMFYQLPLNIRNPHQKIAVPVHPNSSLRDRFLAKVAVEPSGCWSWLGYHFWHGYAGIAIGHSGAYAHRVAYQLFRGPLPTTRKLTIDHLCRHRWCVNPEHLEVVPMHVNQERGLNPFLQGGRNGRTRRCKQGHVVPGDAERCMICRRHLQKIYRDRHPDRARTAQAKWRAKQK
jgi:hypothetical protein